MPLRQVLQVLRVGRVAEPAHQAQAQRREQDRPGEAGGTHFITQEEICLAELNGTDLPELRLNLPPGYLEVLAP